MYVSTRKNYMCSSGEVELFKLSIAIYLKLLCMFVCMVEL